MGIPYHTSRDVPGRCLWLIEQLYSKAQTITAQDGADLGPLNTTFLFAMSTLIITLPVERLERHRRKELAGQQGYMDDRPLDPACAQEIDLWLGDGAPSLDASPFFVPDAWRFAAIAYQPEHNVAVEFPDELAAQLGSDGALFAAQQLNTRDWIGCLRNALAHGGIVYLDAEGQQARGRPTEMMGFVSAIYPRGNMRLPPDKLIALRTTPELYRQTLRRWVAWVQATGLSEAVAA